MRAFSHVVVVCCFMLAGSAVVVQFHSAGPTGVVPRVVQAIAIASAVGLGCRWLWWPWPQYKGALAFVVWADVAIAAVALTMSTVEARLCTTLYLGVIGVFIGFLLGARLLAVHCAFGALLIAGITAWAVVEQHVSLFGLFVIYMPALAWVVGIPLAGCVLIERGRRAIARMARSAHSDQLTRLHNRRGMHHAVKRALAREGSPPNLVVAVCDIDRFKRLNDEHGHAAGDAALIAMADKLRAIVRPGEVVARIGGDELVLVTFTTGAGDIPGLLARLATLTHLDLDHGATLSASIGVAAATTAALHFSLDDVIRHADAAMYEVKRSGGGGCGVYPGWESESADRCI
ncbi:GGDEF domain-containing protein [Mycobacterium sp. PDNC021]|uniref:GGDEF domain-containing protein n=1 Tax=Mycobacterium sp. PDNC021 TaxID=3391399 RepID=UPI003AAA4E3C